jgi:hypothetical protein
MKHAPVCVCVYVVMMICCKYSITPSLTITLLATTPSPTPSLTHQPPRHELLGEVHVQHEAAEEQAVAEDGHSGTAQHLAHLPGGVHLQGEREGGREGERERERERERE